MLLRQPSEPSSGLGFALSYRLGASDVTVSHGFRLSKRALWLTKWPPPWAESSAMGMVLLNSAKEQKAVCKVEGTKEAELMPCALMTSFSQASSYVHLNNYLPSFYK
jgi:hypothetical protein